MHGAKIIPFRSLRKATGEAMPSRHWFVACCRFWHEQMDRLTAYLIHLMEAEMPLPDLKIETPAEEAIIVSTRTFHAPRALVWRVMTEPEHVARWWGIEGHHNLITAFDVRPGGKWRIESHDPDGNVYIFVGEYREVDEPQKFVWTFGMENMFFGKTLLETHTFEEADGKTHYRSLSTFDSIEDRDGMVASGMEQGMVHGFAVIDAILADLVKD